MKLREDSGAMAASVVLLVLLVTVCHVSAEEPHLGQRTIQRREVSALDSSKSLALEEGGVIENDRQLRSTVKRKGGTVTGPRKGKYFSKCPHPQTPAVLANLSSQLIASLASKGYTSAAAAFNSTGVLMGIRHKANLLVPTNAAFENLPAAVTDLLKAHGSFVLRRIMREHMLKAAVQFRGLKRFRFYRTYLHTKLKATATKSSSGFQSLSFTPVNGYSTTPSTIVAPDLVWNCFGHHQGVDHVLIPSLDILTPAEAPTSSPPEASPTRVMLETDPLLSTLQWLEILE